MKHYQARGGVDFLLAIGDDVTDEDTGAVVKAKATYRFGMPVNTRCDVVSRGVCTGDSGGGGRGS